MLTVVVWNALGGVRKLRQARTALAALLALLLIVPSLAVPRAAFASAPSGYSEYYIPGGELQLREIFRDLDNDPSLAASAMHCVIGVTASADNTTIYYDHWEDGYDLDLNDPSTADETFTLNRGQVQRFESANIPVPRTGTPPPTYYDGQDRLYAAGGSVTVTRSSWPEVTGTVFALSWEIYPTKPFLTDYTIPVGQNLASAPKLYDDFARVYVIVQATADGTTVEIDDPETAGVEVSTTLNKGEVTQLYSIWAGTTVHASAPVQAQFIVGQAQAGLYSEGRNYTAVPDSLWDREYYSPVSGHFYSGAQGAYYETDLFLHNPHDAPLTVFYEDKLGTGSFTIYPGDTLSYRDGAGRYVPANSAVHLWAAEVFWGVGSVGTESPDFDWSFSLVPSFALEEEYYLGWAPGTSDTVPTNNGSPAFVTPSQDGTRVYVDLSPTDGTADRTYTLNRLDCQKVFDPDNDNTGMNIWASGPVAVAWGEDPATAGLSTPYLDLGYTTLPMREEWLDRVLALDKTADPEVVLPGAGQTTTFALVTRTFDWATDDVDVIDTLPDGWAYVDDSTTITFPDHSSVSGHDADPAISGQILTWNLDADLAADQALTIAFQAITTGTLADGFSRNEAVATGYRGVAPSRQTFSARDDAFVYVSGLSIDKSSGASGATVEAGDTIEYTIVVGNPSPLVTSHDLVIRDWAPEHTTYVAGSSRVTGYRTTTQSWTVADNFNATPYAYTNNTGTQNWAAAWIEGGENDGPSAGSIRVIGGRLQMTTSGRNLRRTANLTGALSATLAFDYTTSGNLEDGDTVAAEMSSDGGANWTPVWTLANDATGSFSGNVSGFISGATVVRFRLSAGYGSNEYLFIDNVRISYEVVSGREALTGAPAGDLPDLVAAAEHLELEPGEQMVVTFSVLVNDPLPPDATSIINTAQANSTEYPIVIRDTVIDPARPDPTAVTLLAFGAAPAPGGLLISWQTATEIDNLGFNLYRGQGGAPVRINTDLVPAQAPGSPMGARYEYLDADVAPGSAYNYWLEAIDILGGSDWHGPIAAETASLPPEVRLVGRKQYAVQANKLVRLRTSASGMGLREVYLAMADTPEAIPTSPQARYSLVTGLVDAWTGERWNAPQQPGGSTRAQSPYMAVRMDEFAAAWLDDGALEIKWPVLFKLPAIGAHRIYLRAVDASGADSGWVDVAQLVVR